MILIERLGERGNMEVVERKGLGHPDSIMDALAEEVSRALSRHYLDNFGGILHHNVDKGLLVGGEVRVSYGGGEVVKPVKIRIAGRATREWEGKGIDVEGIAREAVGAYLERHLPKLVWDLSVEVRASAPELSAVVHRGLANDTSVGVGYAPLSPLERAVKEVEGNVRALPFVGQDVKVMGVRWGEEAKLTVAAALLAEEVGSREDYRERKARIKEVAEDVLQREMGGGSVEVNTADVVEEDLVYLTLSGSSAEHGDDGQVGRGNRMNGLITPFRPMSLEAAAGKHPKAHVGKVYNAIALLSAQEIWEELGVESEVHLVSAIGKPLHQPQAVALRLSDPREGERALAVVRDWLDRVEEVALMFLEGKLSVW